MSLVLSARFLRPALVFLALAAASARADTLPLPPSLTDLSSDDGEAYLIESHALAAYFPISANFVTQKTQAFCGVASTVMVLNALRAPAPTTPEYAPFHTYTQDNVLDDETDKAVPRETIARQGMTLDQLGAFIAAHGVATDVRHAGEAGVEAFRAEARAALSTRDHYVVINYLRKALGQEIGGHISPLGAYDEKTDRFLVMDVARYKYPPVWVKASDLFDAMNTTDMVSGKTRGYVLVAKDAAALAAVKP